MLHHIIFLLLTYCYAHPEKHARFSLQNQAILIVENSFFSNTA